MKNENKDKNPKPIHLGSSAAVAFALFTYIGHRLDVKYGTGNVYLLGGLALALGWTFYEVWKMTRNTEGD